MNSIPSSDDGISERHQIAVLNTGVSDSVTISGFMILKNAISQGYPFLEAIIAALPICDEFLVSDGNSQDGTWEALQFLHRRHSDKILLFRDEWHGPVEGRRNLSGHDQHS